MAEKQTPKLEISQVLIIGGFFAIANTLMRLLETWLDTGILVFTGRLLFTAIFWFVGGALFALIQWRARECCVKESRH